MIKLNKFNENKSFSKNSDNTYTIVSHNARQSRGNQKHDVASRDRGSQNPHITIFFVKNFSNFSTPRRTISHRILPSHEFSLTNLYFLILLKIKFY